MVTTAELVAKQEQLLSSRQAITQAPNDTEQRLKDLKERASRSALLSSDVARERAYLTPNTNKTQSVVKSNVSASQSVSYSDSDLSKTDTYRSLLDQGDREALANALERNAELTQAKAEELEALINSDRKRYNTRGNKERLKDYRRVVSRSKATAQKIREAPGNITLQERKAVGRSVRPDYKSDQIKRKFYTFGSPERSEVVENQRQEKYTPTFQPEKEKVLVKTERGTVKSEYRYVSPPPQTATAEPIPEYTPYTGPTTGKPSGVYISPLTGKPVYVRENKLDAVPTASRSKRTRAPASSRWDYNYTVYATVGGEEYKGKSSQTPPTLEVSPAPPVTDAGDFGQAPGDWVLLQDNSTNPNYATTTSFSPTGSEEWVPRPKATLEEREYVNVFTAPVSDADKVTTQGRQQVSQAKAELKEGDFLNAGGLFVAGSTAQFLGGVRNAVTGFQQDPGLALGVFGVYTAVGLTTGGAGVGVLFAGQNVVEFSGGQTPSVVRAVKDPYVFAGEVSPYLVAGGVLNKGVTYTEGKIATAQAKGTVLNPEQLPSVVRTPQTDVSVQLRADPVESVQFLQATKGTSPGATQTKTYVEPKYGDPVFLTQAEAGRQPVTFITETSVTKATRSRPQESPADFEPTINLDGTTYYNFKNQVGPYSDMATVSYTTRGRTTIKQVQEIADANLIYDFDVRPSTGKPGTVTEGLLFAETRFTPYDNPPTSALTVPKGAEARGPTRAKAEQLEKTGGQLNEPPAKLDYFEQIVVEGPGGAFAIQESPYTGAIQRAGTPLIVREITVSPTTKGTAKAGATGGAGGSKNIIEVEVPQSDGTVKIQTIRFDEPAQTKQKTEQKTETQQKQEEQRLQRQREENAKKQKKSFDVYTYQRYGTTPLTEAIAKFRAVNRVAVAPALATRITPTQGQRLGTAQRQAQRQSSAEASDQITQFAPAQEQPITFRSDQATDTVPDLVQERTPFFARPVPGRPRPPQPVAEETLKPVVPFNYRATKKRANALFDVLVKKKGRFIKTDSGLSLKEATQRGALITGTTASASFKLRGEEKVDDEKALGFLGLKFRRSKSQKGVFVEKSKYRIDTPGELGEITFKGQAVQRQRTNKNRGRFKWV